MDCLGYLSQYLPAEVAEEIPSLGISELNSIEGRAALVNEGDKIKLMYELSLGMEVVIDGVGKQVQLADLTSEKLECELN